jgi:hypothetical protein
MTPTHILRNIPPEVQRRYGINAEAKAEADGSVMGGHLTIETKAGGTVGVDAVELTGTDITIEPIPT